jgi:hypothetical protein
MAPEVDTKTGWLLEQKALEANEQAFRGHFKVSGRINAGRGEFLFLSWLK